MAYEHFNNFHPGVEENEYDVRRALAFKPMVVRNFQLFETSGYKDQYIRPISLQTDWENLHKIENLVDRAVNEVGSRVTAAAIARTAPDLAMPMKNPVAKITLPGGFRDKRFKFILELEQEGAAKNIKHITFIQGYTDFLGVMSDSQGNVFLDPNMKLYANNVIYLAKVTDSTGYTRTKIVYHFTILHRPDGTVEVEDITYQHPSYMREKPILPVRPTDILAAIKQNELVSSDFYGPSANTRITTRSLVSPLAANKALNIPTYHVSETINGVISGAYTRYETDSIYDAALDNIPEVSLEHDIPFFTRLSDLYGGKIVNTFTIRDLIQIDPRAEEKAELIMARQNATVEYFVNMFGTDSEEMYQPTLENTIATLLAEGISSLMSDNMLKKIHVAFTNATGENRLIVMPYPNSNKPMVEPLVEGIDVVYWANRFMTQLENVIIPSVTYNGQMLVEFDVLSEINTETIIRLSINGNPEVVYRIPIFADGTFNPNLANDAVVNNIMDDYKEIIDSTTVNPILNQ